MRKKSKGRFVYREFTRTNSRARIRDLENTTLNYQDQPTSSSELALYPSGFDTESGAKSHIVVPSRPLQPRSSLYKPVYDFPQPAGPGPRYFSYIRKLQRLALMARIEQENNLRRRIIVKQIIATLKLSLTLLLASAVITIAVAYYQGQFNELLTLTIHFFK